MSLLLCAARAISWEEGPYGNWEDGFGAAREYCIDCKANGCAPGACQPMGYNKTVCGPLAHRASIAMTCFCSTKNLLFDLGK
jgi:hypothetical protein